MRSIVLAAAAALLASAAAAEEAAPAVADSAQQRDITIAVATVVAGEEPCGLRYNQDAIAAYLELYLPADSAAFPATFNVQVTATRASLGGMTESQKTAFCTQVRRLAEHMAFTN